MEASEENKAVARYVERVFGGSASFREYLNEDETLRIDVLKAANAPQPGIASYCTLGLSDHSIDLWVETKPLRVELATALGDSDNVGANIVSTCAFEAITSKAEITPGYILPNVVALYRPNGPMLHAILLPPNLWSLETQPFDAKIVTFLQVVPISDAERELAEQEGSDALEDLFEQAQIDLFDLDRASAV